MSTQTAETGARAALRAWVLEHASGVSPEALGDRTPLLEDRILRSLHVPELLLFIERLRGTPVDVAALRAGDFRDLETIFRTFLEEATR